MASVAEKVRGSIEDLVLNGTLSPGKKVPSERQLSERLGVSRSMIREALQELRAKKIIHTYQGRGSYVAEMIEPVDKQGPLLGLILSHPESIFDVLDVRETLEAQASALAAENGTDQDHYWITKAFKAMQCQPEKSTNSAIDIDLDHAFHTAIYSASNNPVLMHLLKSLSGLMKSSVMQSVNNLYHSKKYKSLIDADHEAIYTAILQRESEAARIAAANHIQHVREGLKIMQRKSGEKASNI